MKSRRANTHAQGRQCPHGHDEWYNKKAKHGWVCAPCKRQRSAETQRNNPERARKRTRAWAAANPHRHRRNTRASRLRVQYDLTLEDFDRMLKSQRGRCALCREPMTRKEEPAVDHCHKTGIVRELLCLLCNSMLGKAKDDPELLRAGARYLDRFNHESTE